MLLQFDYSSILLSLKMFLNLFILENTYKDNTVLETVKSIKNIKNANAICITCIKVITQNKQVIKKFVRTIFSSLFVIWCGNTIFFIFLDFSNSYISRLGNQITRIIFAGEIWNFKNFHFFRWEISSSINLVMINTK